MEGCSVMTRKLTIWAFDRICAAIILASAVQIFVAEVLGFDSLQELWGLAP